MSQSTITAEALARKNADSESIDLIDVRTPFEYQEVHVEFARNIPLDQLDPETIIQTRNGSGDSPLYVICRSGSRGAKACQQFQQAGFENVVNVEGGTLACEQTSLPLKRGRKAMSLERQVRIAAGMLVLVGIGLSWVHPAFLGLSAFVGAGLVFAGITDTCGMGLMLARMPWNRATC